MKHIDNFFREELGTYAELPPPPAWGALEKRLDEEKKRRAFPYRWIWFVSVIALLGITGLSVAWKMSASRPLLAGTALPTGQKHPAVANVTGNTATTTSNTAEQNTGAHTAPANSIKTDKHAITATQKKKHTAHHMALASSHTPRMSPQKQKALKKMSEEKIAEPVMAKTDRSVTQYPDEDYYEGATASIAATPAEASAPAGYTVNKRKRHNMLVADMSPKQEQHAYTAAPAPHDDAAEEPATVANATAKSSSVASIEHKESKAASRATHRHKPAAQTALAAKAKKQPDTRTATVAATVAVKNNLPNRAATQHIAATAKAKAPTAVALTTAVAAIAPKHEVAQKANTTATTIASAPVTKPATSTATNVAQKQPATPKTTVTGTAAITQPVTAEIAKPVPASQPATIVAATSAATKKHEKQVALNTPAAESKPATAAIAASTTAVAGKNNKSKQPQTAAEHPIETPATTSVAATTKATALAKTAQPVLAATPAPKKAGKATAAKNTIADQPTAKQPEILVVSASTPKAKHSRKARAVAKEDKAATTVAAIAGIQPAKKAAKKPAEKASDAIAVAPAPVTKEAATPKEKAKAIVSIAKTTKAPAAKEQPKMANKAGKPAIDNYASAAKPGPKTHAASKTSSPAKAYAGKISHMTEEEMPTEDPTGNTTASNTLAAAGREEQAQPLPGTFKEKAFAAGQPVIVQKDDIKPQADSTPVATKRKRFEAGIKAGFEGSYNGDAAKKLVISPYLDYKISNKFSLMVQPAFKGANLQMHSLTGTQTFYNVTHTDSTLTSTNAVIIVYPGGIDTVGAVRTYSYSQTHDSIVKSYSLGGTYFEFEIPLLLKYAITPKLSMYAGLNINYSRAIRINEHNYTSGPITKVDNSIAAVTGNGQPTATPPAVSSVFSYAGQPVASYAGPMYPNSSEGMLRLGYMLGFSYEFQKRWLLDALVQQGFAKSNVLGGFDVNKPLTLPYVRLTLGYRLTK